MGSMTTITIRNRSTWVIGAKPTFTLHGKLAKAPSWCPPETIALIRNEDGGLSIINPKNVVEIDGKKYVYKNQTKTYSIQGSKGNTYVVTEANGKYTCSCTGFQFRKTCKHLGMIK